MIEKPAVPDDWYVEPIRRYPADYSDYEFIAHPDDSNLEEDEWGNIVVFKGSPGYYVEDNNGNTEPVGPFNTFDEALAAFTVLGFK